VYCKDVYYGKFYGGWNLHHEFGIGSDADFRFKEFAKEYNVNLRRKSESYKKHVKHIFEDDSFECLLLFILQHRRMGYKFDICVPLHEIIDTVDDGTVATFYCSELKLVIEPLRGEYTELIMERDRLYFLKGLYVLRVREQEFDLDSVRLFIGNVLLHFSKWKRERKRLLKNEKVTTLAVSISNYADK